MANVICELVMHEDTLFPWMSECEGDLDGLVVCWRDQVSIPQEGTQFFSDR